jgi:hypothetical protein
MIVQDNFVCAPPPRSLKQCSRGMPHCMSLVQDGLNNRCIANDTEFPIDWQPG